MNYIYLIDKARCS